jgi:glycosyltransferase involved in cell wall biosynthesis
VVTNAPLYVDLEPTPVHEPVRILHHGGAQPGRGLEQMLRIADLLDERFTLDFVLTESKPGYRDKLIRRARGKRNVRFPPPRPMHELPRMANGYDIGLYLLPPTSFNQRYALPNKFFEFIQGRLAVAIGPSPEMARLVEQYGCGILADDFEPEALATAINALDGPTIAAFKRASHAAARELCAERDAELVLTVVEEALSRPD